MSHHGLEQCTTRHKRAAFPVVLLVRAVRERRARTQNELDLVFDLPRTPPVVGVKKRDVPARGLPDAPIARDRRPLFSNQPRFSGGCAIRRRVDPRLGLRNLFRSQTLRIDWPVEQARPCLANAFMVERSVAAITEGL